MVDETFAARLVPMKEADDPERGDTVYEQTRFGSRPEDVRYRKRRVLEVNRGGVKVVDPEGNVRSATIVAKGRLFVEREPESQDPPTATHRNPPPSASGNQRAAGSVSQSAQRAQDEQYAAWLDMGRGLVAELDGTLTGLAEQREKLLRDIDAIDETHARRIGQLEQQLTAARHQHADDRALALAKLEKLDADTEHAGARRRALESLLGDGEAQRP